VVEFSDNSGQEETLMNREGVFESAKSIAALFDDGSTTMCTICHEQFDDHSTGLQAPIAPACCGVASCRACVVTFHAAKQEASTNNRIKFFPCLSCNVPKALQIEKLPVPHQGFLRLLSVTKELAGQVTGLESSPKIEASSDADKNTCEEVLRQRAGDSQQQRFSEGAFFSNEALQLKIEEAVANALAVQAESNSEALFSREQREKLDRQRIVAEALQAQAEQLAEREEISQKKAIDAALEDRRKNELLEQKKAVNKALQVQAEQLAEREKKTRKKQRETELLEREREVNKAVRMTREREALSRGKRIATAVDAALKDVMTLLAKTSKRAEFAESEIAKVKAEAAFSAAELEREKSRLRAKSESKSASRDVALEEVMAALAETSRRVEHAESNSATAEAQAASISAELEREKARAKSLEAAVDIARSEYESALLNATKRESDQSAAFKSELAAVMAQAEVISSKAATAVLAVAKQVIVSKFESSPDSTSALSVPSTSTSSSDSRSSSLTLSRNAVSTPSSRMRKRSRWGMAPEPLSTPCLLSAFQTSKDTTTLATTEMSDAEFFELRRNHSVLATVEATGGEGKDGKQLASDAMRKSKAPDVDSSQLSSTVTNFQPSPLQTNNHGRTYRTLTFPFEYFYLLIGPQGETIRSIGQRSRTLVNISKGSGSTCTATITGSPDSIERAVELITHQVTSAVPRNTRSALTVASPKPSESRQSVNDVEDRPGSCRGLAASSKCADSSGAGGDRVAIPVAEAELLASPSDMPSLVPVGIEGAQEVVPKSPNKQNDFSCRSSSNSSGELSSQQVHDAKSRPSPVRPENPKAEALNSAEAPFSTPSAEAEAATLDVKGKVWLRRGEQDGINSKSTPVETKPEFAFLSRFSPSALQVDDLTGHTYRTLMVPNDLCAAIIGSGGENHRFIQKRSRSRLRVRGTQWIRTVTVYGAASSIEHAFQLISNILDEGEQKNPAQSQSMASRIGSRLEEQDIEEDESGGQQGNGGWGDIVDNCGDNGLDEQAAREEGQIEDAQDQDTSVQGEGGCAVSDGHDRELTPDSLKRKTRDCDIDSVNTPEPLTSFQPSHLQVDSRGMSFRTLVLPHIHCSLIIGLRGETIRSIRERSHAYVTVPICTNKGAPRLVTVMGSLTAIGKAFELISQLFLTLADVDERKTKKQTRVKLANRLGSSLEEQDERKKTSLGELGGGCEDETWEEKLETGNGGGKEYCTVRADEEQGQEDGEDSQGQQDAANEGEGDGAASGGLDTRFNCDLTPTSLKRKTRDCAIGLVNSPETLDNFQPSQIQFDSSGEPYRTLLLPAKQCTLIIGYRGETIQSIQERSHAYVTVPKCTDKGAPRLVTVMGSLTSIESAFYLMSQLFLTGVDLGEPKTKNRTRVMLASRLGSCLEEQDEGQNAGSIELDRRCEDVTWEEELETGNEEGWEDCTVWEDGIADEEQGQDDGKVGEDGSDYDNGDEVVDDFQKTGRKSISSAADVEYLETPTSLIQFHPSTLQTTSSGKNYRTLEMPSRHCTYLIGIGGETLRSIQQCSRARVTIADKNSAKMRTVTVTGSQHSIEHAFELISQQVPKWDVWSSQKKTRYPKGRR
jgi:hypothetical protein